MQKLSKNIKISHLIIFRGNYKDLNLFLMYIFGYLIIKFY
jgi:hypothetical protein